MALPSQMSDSIILSPVAVSLPAASPSIASSSVVDTHCPQPQPLPHRITQVVKRSAGSNNDHAESGYCCSGRVSMLSIRNIIVNSIGDNFKDGLPPALTKCMRKAQIAGRSHQHKRGKS
ncbi:hypothetical protein CY34DRAFT_17393 [Suillus luteus UH-Slu-Lm8-n1]|uniref:Uncharacterized protein n=1 Tax=Suillus luteus UH-Slu-Lm8-n1 TaxID=930992 RepID=A0A0C9ZZF4_9AGAM|nr:hypothetical protein CY34DRAFT_17393 [Suillus luteus UH-Slu-Lm8-n1]